MFKVQSIFGAVALATLLSQASGHVHRIVHEPMKITREAQSVIQASIPLNPYQPTRRRDIPEDKAESWSWPVSYRVAIVLDAFVFMVTLVALFVLAVYIRKQYRKRKLLELIREEIGSVDEEVPGRENAGAKVARRKTGNGREEGLKEEWSEKRHQRSWSLDTEYESKFGQRASVGYAGSSVLVNGK